MTLDNRSFIKILTCPLSLGGEGRGGEGRGGEGRGEGGWNCHMSYYLCTKQQLNMHYDLSRLTSCNKLVPSDSKCAGNCTRSYSLSQCLLYKKAKRALGIFFFS